VSLAPTLYVSFPDKKIKDKSSFNYEVDGYVGVKKACKANKKKVTNIT